MVSWPLLFERLWKHLEMASDSGLCLMGPCGCHLDREHEHCPLMTTKSCVWTVEKSSSSPRWRPCCSRSGILDYASPATVLPSRNRVLGAWYGFGLEANCWFPGSLRSQISSRMSTEISSTHCFKQPTLRSCLNAPTRSKTPFPVSDGWLCCMAHANDGCSDARQDRELLQGRGEDPRGRGAWWWYGPGTEFHGQRNHDLPTFLVHHDLDMRCLHWYRWPFCLFADIIRACMGQQEGFAPEVQLCCRLHKGRYYGWWFHAIGPHAKVCCMTPLWMRWREVSGSLGLSELKALTFQRTHPTTPLWFQHQTLAATNSWFELWLRKDTTFLSAVQQVLPRRRPSRVCLLQGFSADSYADKCIRILCTDNCKPDPGCRWWQVGQA